MAACFLERKGGVRMQRVAFATLWLTLASEVVYVVYAHFALEATWGHLIQPLVFVVLGGLLAATQGRVRWIPTLLRILIGIEFVLSVADRCGLLGPAGNWVSWGDFTHFVAYTRQVNSFLPASIA